MLATISVSTPTLMQKMITQMENDVSARPAWFVRPSGLDMSSWGVTETPEKEFPLSDNALRPPINEWNVVALPSPANVFVPKTALARRLWELRKQIVASGEPLLDWEGVQSEIMERRAERG